MTLFVIDESVRHRPFGGAHVMRAQLERLAAVAEWPDVIVQILTFEATDQPGARGPMRILDLSGAPSVAYTEGAGTGRVIETPGEVAEAVPYCDRIRAAALPRSAALSMLARFGEKYDLA